VTRPRDAWKADASFAAGGKADTAIAARGASPESDDWRKRSTVSLVGGHPALRSTAVVVALGVASLVILVPAAAAVLLYLQADPRAMDVALTVTAASGAQIGLAGAVLMFGGAVVAALGR
jgi:hypothetical protein